MISATVTELPRRLEPVTRDTFIDGCPVDVGPAADRLPGRPADVAAEVAPVRDGGSRPPA